MPTKEINKIEESKQRQITGILMALEAIIEEASNQISDSLALHDIGKETEITKIIRESIENPISNIANSNKILASAIEQLKINLVTSFARNKKENLNFVAYSVEDYCTHFFIGLKEDSFETRDYFYTLLNKYEKYNISETHPLIFHFVSSDMLESVNDLQNIPLDEQASKSMPSK